MNELSDQREQREHREQRDFRAEERHERTELHALRMEHAITVALKDIREMQNTASMECGRLAEKLDRIESQVKITNGRVTVLELWRATRESQLAIIFLLSTIAGGLITLLLPMLIEKLRKG